MSMVVQYLNIDNKTASLAAGLFEGTDKHGCGKKIRPEHVGSMVMSGVSAAKWPTRGQGRTVEGVLLKPRPRVCFQGSNPGQYLDYAKALYAGKPLICEI